LENLDNTKNSNNELNINNSNKKITKIDPTKRSTAKIKNNNNKNRYHGHHKTRSSADNDNNNNNTMKNRENNYVNTNKNNYNNYLLTNNRSMINENQKITKIKSSRCASVKPINTNSNSNLSKIKKLNKMTNINNISNNSINISNNISKQILEPRKYNGPIDIKCILVTSSLDLLIEKISNLLKINKISKTFVNPYKLKCSKGGENFEIEFMTLNNNIIKSNISKESFNKFNSYKEFTSSSFNETEIDIKCDNENSINNTERKSYKKLMLYYFTISTKITNNNNKKIVKMISKIIGSKNFIKGSK
jgi:hypothetical protein